MQPFADAVAEMVVGWTRTVWTNRSGPIPIPMGWRERAECRDLPYEFFFGDDKATLYESSRFCVLRCPVRAQCAIASVIEDIELDCDWTTGIRGGLLATERAALRRAVEPRLPVRVPDFAEWLAGRYGPSQR